MPSSFAGHGIPCPYCQTHPAFPPPLPFSSTGNPACANATTHHDSHHTSTTRERVPSSLRSPLLHSRLVIESLKIVLTCIIAAIFYGVIHDQFTARICLEYFTVFHPPIFNTQSPTLLALGWGIIATWWVGAILGFLLAIASRAGSRPKLPAVALLTPIAKLLLLMSACAALSGFAGFILARRGTIAPPEWVASTLLPAAYPSFIADWYAHSASYAVGFIGGIALCITQFRRRGRMLRS